MSDPVKMNLKDMTRELWAKYEWLREYAMDAEDGSCIRGYMRGPREAHSAFIEFETFEKIWHKETNNVKTT